MKIEQCPFCGGNAEVWQDKTIPSETHGYWFVACRECNAQTAAYIDKENAINAWNRRTRNE